MVTKRRSKVIAGIFGCVSPSRSHALFDFHLFSQSILFLLYSFAGAEIKCECCAINLYVCLRIAHFMRPNPEHINISNNASRSRRSASLQQSSIGVVNILETNCDMRIAEQRQRQEQRAYMHTIGAQKQPHQHEQLQTTKKTIKINLIYKFPWYENTSAVCTAAAFHRVKWIGWNKMWPAFRWWRWMEMENLIVFDRMWHRTPKRHQKNRKRIKSIPFDTHCPGA